MKFHPRALALVLCGVNVFAAESLTVAVGRRVLKTEQWFPADTATLTGGIAPMREGVALSLRVAWGAERRRPQADPALAR